MDRKASTNYPIEVVRLRKAYAQNGVLRKGRSFEAVRGISFEVRAGECFGLLGPNGAGKSTVIQCVTGFYPPSSGEARVLGHNVYAQPKKARMEMGVCSQEDSLDTDFSVIDQLIRHATFFRVHRDEAEKRAWELLSRFGLEERAHFLVEKLSGGMKRKLQVARALISKPRVLILDEPTTGLDPEARRLLWGLLMRERERGLAILLSTHYMDEAERLCDRIALMHEGSILDLAPPMELIRRHVGTEPVVESFHPDWEAGFTPDLSWKRPPNLEDVFLKLAGHSLKTFTGSPVEAGNRR